MPANVWAELFNKFLNVSILFQEWKHAKKETSVSTSDACLNFTIFGLRSRRHQSKQENGLTGRVVENQHQEAIDLVSQLRIEVLCALF